MRFGNSPITFDCEKVTSQKHLDWRGFSHQSNIGFPS
jgi:hypothetical protein